MKQSTQPLIEIINLLQQIVVHEELDFQQFLKKLIKLIGKIIITDSCLIYFYDQDQQNLVLVGSKKVKTKLIGNIAMKSGEGITGWVAAHRKSVAINKKAYQDKRFKAFSELPEDLYEAFLSVPIVGRNQVIGVLNLQNRLPLNFKQEQVKILEAIGKIISSAFESEMLTKKVSELEEKIAERKLIEKAKGMLMEMRKISENEAFQLIRQEAMNKRKPIKQIAEAIILIANL